MEFKVGDQFLFSQARVPDQLSDWFIGEITQIAKDDVSYNTLISSNGFAKLDLSTLSTFSLPAAGLNKPAFLKDLFKAYWI